MKLVSNPIDELSQDDLDIDEGDSLRDEIGEERGQPGDEPISFNNFVPSSKDTILEQFDRKSLNKDKMEIAAVSNEFFDDIHQFIPAEPKSGLLKQKSIRKNDRGMNRGLNRGLSSNDFHTILVRDHSFLDLNKSER